MLIDVHMQEMLKLGKQHTYTTSLHSFAMGVGPEGVIIWQSYGSPAGYGLGEYIGKGGADIRSWDGATEFVDSFEKFVAYKVSGFACFVDF